MNESLVADDSLTRALYGLIICRLDGTFLNSAKKRQEYIDLTKSGIAGFLLFGGKRKEIKDFIAEVQRYAYYPLLIASDVEKGTGQQVQGTTVFPCQMAVSAAFYKRDGNDARDIRLLLKSICSEAADVGINMPLIPVVDVNTNPLNPIICNRAFSDDPEKTAWYSRLYIEAIKETGLISCAKHFPGHGSTQSDSHLTLPVINKTLDELNEVELIPFKYAIDAEVDSIMVGHLSLPLIDSLPATVSEEIVTNLLRNTLSFDGLILTDALNMDALKGIESVHTKCINAGADILLHPVSVVRAVSELNDSIETGALKVERVYESFKRVLNLRKKLKTAGTDFVDYKSHDDLSHRLFEKSITLVKGDLSSSFMEKTCDVKFIYLGGFSSRILLYTLFGGNNIMDKPFIDGKRVVAAIYTSVSAFSKNFCVSDMEIRSLKRIIKRAGHTTVISFGNPYVLKHFEEADVLIAAYDTSEKAEMAVLRCLMGETPMEGCLPVKL
ncbi:MAG: hypothetical protein HQK92_03785 [Nitrospirae bacterium]|nr:hypothetical protein [Nitrospirota bacterium]